MGAELIADHASTVIVLLGFALGAQKEFNIFPIIPQSCWISQWENTKSVEITKKTSPAQGDFSSSNPLKTMTAAVAAQRQGSNEEP